VLDVEQEQVPARPLLLLISRKGGHRSSRFLASPRFAFELLQAVEHIMADGII
jgi:hypothetical protein